MMNEDHARALDRLRSARDEIIEPSITICGGRVVKRLGDGWLAVFETAPSACEAAIRIQHRMDAAGATQLRIGIHEGTASFVDEDVFGAGVNIASRLEAIARPGGIAISDDVFAALPQHLRASFEDAGARSLKNIADPVRVAGVGQIARSRCRIPYPGIGTHTGNDGSLEVSIRPSFLSGSWSTSARCGCGSAAVDRHFGAVGGHERRELVAEPVSRTRGASARRRSGGEGPRRHRTLLVPSAIIIVGRGPLREVPDLACLAQGIGETAGSRLAVLTDVSLVDCVRKVGWWRGRDSNPRPQDYESCALTS